MRIRVGHLYPEYLNIYADRGNIAVLARRAALRGHELEVRADRPRRRRSIPDALRPPLRRRRPGSRAGAHRSRSRGEGRGDASGACARRRAARRVRRLPAPRARLPRSRRLVHAGRGALPARDGRGRRADDRRRPARVRARARQSKRRSPASRTTPARTLLDPGAEPLGRVVHGFGNDGESGFEGCRLGSAVGTYLHGPLLPRNPWLADWLLAQRWRTRAQRPPGAAPTSSRRRRFARSAERARGGSAESAIP